MPIQLQRINEVLMDTFDGFSGLSQMATEYAYVGFYRGVQFKVDAYSNEYDVYLIARERLTEIYRQYMADLARPMTKFMEASPSSVVNIQPAEPIKEEPHVGRKIQLEFI